MTSAARWPLHSTPIIGEALSSWLHRLSSSYQMSVHELIEHGLGLHLEGPADLDRDPEPALLDALVERTGIDRHRLEQMSLAGLAPALGAVLKAQSGVFDAYVRTSSVLLKPAKRSRHRVGPWRPWIPRDRLQRACPVCVDDPTLRGLRLMWQFPVQLSCPDHGCMLVPCIGFPGDYLAWTGDPGSPRAAPETVVTMDRRSAQALRSGQVDLPGRTVSAREWFRILRTVLDEVSTPATYWGSHAADLRRIWADCGHPVRAGQATWRPFEHYPWAVQSQTLAAAAEAIHLVETGTITALDGGAGCFVRAADTHSVCLEGCDDHVDRLASLGAALEEAVGAAQADPIEAQRLYALLVFGCRTPASIDQLRATFSELGIPTAELSYNRTDQAFA